MYTLYIIALLLLAPFGIFAYLFATKKPTTEAAKNVKAKMVIRFGIGLIMFITGIILTVISKGNAIFYGAIVAGYVLVLASIFQVSKIK